MPPQQCSSSAAWLGLHEIQDGHSEDSIFKVSSRNRSPSSDACFPRSITGVARRLAIGFGPEAPLGNPSGLRVGTFLCGGVRLRFHCSLCGESGLALRFAFGLCGFFLGTERNSSLLRRCGFPGKATSGSFCHQGLIQRGLGTVLCKSCIPRAGGGFLPLLKRWNLVCGHKCLRVLSDHNPELAHAAPRPEMASGNA